MEVTALGLVRLINTGVIAYQQVAPLLEKAIVTGEPVSLEEVARSSGKSTQALLALSQAIEVAIAEGR